MKKVITRVTRSKMQPFLQINSMFAWLLFLTRKLLDEYSLMLLFMRYPVQEDMVTRWLLVWYSLMQLFIRYPIKEEINLDKDAGVLLERSYLWLHLWGIWQMIIGVLINAEPCISNMIHKHRYGFSLFCSTWFCFDFVQFHYAIT